MGSWHSHSVRSQKLLTGHWERYWVNVEVADLFGFRVDHQIKVVLDQLVKAEEPPVRNQLCDFLGEFTVEIFERDLSVHLVHHDFIKFELCVYGWASNFVDFAAGLFELEGVENALGYIVDMDWLSQLGTVVEHWNEIVPGFGSGKEFFYQVIIWAVNLESQKSTKICLTVVGLMIVALGNSSRTACSPQYLVWRSRLGESGLAPTAEK